MVNSDPRTGLARPWVPDGDRKKSTEDLNIILESETPKENFETNKKIHFRRRRGHCYFGKIFEILCNSYYEFILDCHPIRCGCGKDQFLLQVKSLRITLGPFEDRTFIG